MYPFVAVPNFPVINNFEASVECIGVFVNRANVAVPWDSPRPTTTRDDPAALSDPGLSRLFLYDPIGQWVNLSSCEEYDDECDFYHCPTLEAAEAMLDVCMFEDKPDLWIWKPIPDDELSAFLGVEADWINGYGIDEEDEDDLGAAVFKALDLEKSKGNNMLLWPALAIAEDIRDLDNGLENWAAPDLIPYVKAWMELHTPRPYGYEVFTHKDGFRRWWKIEMWYSGLSKYNPAINEDGVCDEIWEYRISQEIPTELDGWFSLHQNRLVGQYDERPKLRDVMADFMQYVTRISLDVSAHEVSRGSNGQLVK